MACPRFSPRRTISARRLGSSRRRWTTRPRACRRPSAISTTSTRAWAAPLPLPTPSAWRSQRRRRAPRCVGRREPMWCGWARQRERDRAASRKERGLPATGRQRGAGAQRPRPPTDPGRLTVGRQQRPRNAEQPRRHARYWPGRCCRADNCSLQQRGRRWSRPQGGPGHTASNAGEWRRAPLQRSKKRAWGTAALLLLFSPASPRRMSAMGLEAWAAASTRSRLASTMSLG